VLVLVVTILLSIGAFVSLNGRASAFVVHTEPANAPSPRPAFIPSLGVDVVPQKSVHTIGHVVSGDMAGLYGGAKSNTCDATAIAVFLGANPAQADAWARALLLQPGDIARYLATLTPLTLRTDTAVTNHGFEDGAATPFQSVLQAGTAVLVDAEGLPRVRCYCGNPLQVPAPRTDVDIRNVSFEGPRWEGFEPESVTSVDPAPTQIDTFVVLDQDNDTVVIRPRSTKGGEDRAVSVEVDNSVRNNFVLNDVEVRAATGTPESSVGLVPYGAQISSQSDAAIAAGGGQLNSVAPSSTTAATVAFAPAGTAQPSVGSSASVTETSGPPASTDGGPTAAGSQDLVVTTSSPGGGTTMTTTKPTTTTMTTTKPTTTTMTTTKPTTTTTTTTTTKPTSKTTTKPTSKTTTEKAAADETESE
jgi:hypothetical protein